jgi:hypothetical protein
MLGKAIKALAVLEGRNTELLDARKLIMNGMETNDLLHDQAPNLGAMDVVLQGLCRRVRNSEGVDLSDMIRDDWNRIEVQLLKQLPIVIGASSIPATRAKYVATEDESMLDSISKGRSRVPIEPIEGGTHEGRVGDVPGLIHATLKDVCSKEILGSALGIVEHVGAGMNLAEEIDAFLSLARRQEFPSLFSEVESRQGG